MSIMSALVQYLRAGARAVEAGEDLLVPMSAGVVDARHKRLGPGRVRKFLLIFVINSNLLMQILLRF